MIDELIGLCVGLLTVGLIVGIVFAVVWLRSPGRWMRRQLAQYPRVAIATADDGSMVCISGRIRPVGAPLAAPVSQRPCVAWQLVVERRHGAGRGAHWVKLVDEQEVTDFCLESPGGDRVLIRGSDTKIFARTDRRFRRFKGFPGSLQVLLTARGYDTRGLILGKNLSAAEGIFEVDNEVVIAGTVRDLGEDPEHPGRRRLRLEPLHGEWILASDHPKHRGAR